MVAGRELVFSLCSFCATGRSLLPEGRVSRGSGRLPRARCGSCTLMPHGARRLGVCRARILDSARAVRLARAAWRSLASAGARVPSLRRWVRVARIRSRGCVGEIRPAPPTPRGSPCGALRVRRPLEIDVARADRGPRGGRAGVRNGYPPRSGFVRVRRALSVRASGCGVNSFRRIRARYRAVADRWHACLYARAQDVGG